MNLEQIADQIFSDSPSSITPSSLSTSSTTLGSTSTSTSPSTSTESDDSGSGNSWVLPVSITLGVLGIVFITFLVACFLHRRLRCGSRLFSWSPRTKKARPIPVMRSVISSAKNSLASSSRRGSISILGDFLSITSEKYRLRLGAQSLAAKVRERDFSREFAAVRARDPTDLSTSVAIQAHNIHKNRFSNVLPYDGNRIVLKRRPMTETQAESAGDGVIVHDLEGHDEKRHENDYINASYVSGYSGEKEFICTQGPKRNTVANFWWMCWETEAVAIVMLTKCYENGREKCFPYWPMELHTSVTHDHLKVTLEDVTLYELGVNSTSNEHDHDETRESTPSSSSSSSTSTSPTHSWLVSTLKLENEETEETRRLRHIAFLSWPDFGVVEPPSSLLAFVRSARLHFQESETDPRRKPVVVHCSAGIGRTGVFIAVDHLLQKIDTSGSKVTEDVVNVFQLVCRMRQERMGMVQTQMQYRLVYNSLLELVQAAGNIPEAIPIQNHVFPVQLVEFGLQLPQTLNTFTVNEEVTTK